ncbi:hypothetical protein [Streptomyces sp. NPDC059651]
MPMSFSLCREFRAAVLDRLLHNCKVVPINGNNCLLEARLQAIEWHTDVA